MKKEVLLINLPSDSFRSPEEHCGLALLDAFLSSKEIRTNILDAYAENRSLDECKEYIDYWIQKKIDSELYIGISLFVTNYKYFIELSSYIKKRNVKIHLFVGGHFASLNKEYLLEKNIFLDAIIVGEGEISLYEMITHDWNENINGVYKREFIDNYHSRNRIVDLDLLPFQTRYLNKIQLKGQPFAITTSRGCYGECSFCSISSFYKLNTPHIKYTYRSAKLVSEEIHQLVKKYNIDVLKIVDDNFFRNKSNDFLKQLIELTSDLDISFRLSARPNDITKERAALLKKLGAIVVAIGVESANEDSIKLFNKGININESELAIQYLKENNITCLANFIMFDPIIDKAGLKKNCEFIAAHIDDSIFHRINSHLWIRSTDPIVNVLKKHGLCKEKAFPYVKCTYKSPEVMEIREKFDKWCDLNMKEYYSYVDILMTRGIRNNEFIYKKYKSMIKQDLNILMELIEKG